MSASRRFRDSSDDCRCQWTIILRDDSEARCGRRHVDGVLCTQHAKILAVLKFDCCGGNDEFPPAHCADCSGQADQQAKPEAQP
ncbi:P33 [Xanthomonas phage phiL7]|uniref:p33 n=1 Tax=Xanthomonas phage phiL7 TaxID=538979 RepID=C4ML33_9CAUD|nr:P33 [Xanthomonas phage phiL7]ACE75773.1 P33 [Xanthomonas phage phiL7]